MLERALALGAVVSILLGGALLLKAEDAPTSAPAREPAAPDAPEPQPRAPEPPPPQPRDERPPADPPPEAPKKPKGGLPIVGPILR